MYLPIFKGPVEGWTVNWTKKEFWRVESIMEWSDVMQEAYIVFMRCAAKYPDLRTPSQFMALYKRAWNNQFNDLSTEATKHRAMSLDTTNEEGEAMEPMGETNNDGELAIMINQAPNEVRQVLSLLLNSGQEMLDVLLQDWNGHNRRRTDGGGLRINRALGLPPQTDVLQMVENYFRP